MTADVIPLGSTVTTERRGCYDYTAQEFLQAQAQAAGLTLADFAEIGLTAEPCRCSFGHCTGWQLVLPGLRY